VPVQGCTVPLPYSRAIPLLPLWAVRPVQSLSACTRVTFTFTLSVPSSRNIQKLSLGGGSLKSRKLRLNCNQSKKRCQEAGTLRLLTAVVGFLENKRAAGEGTVLQTCPSLRNITPDPITQPCHQLTKQQTKGGDVLG
jgi:hypothetical protein